MKGAGIQTSRANFVVGLREVISVRVITRSNRHRYAFGAKAQTKTPQS